MSKQFKRILALIMALALCVSLLPGVALAEAPDEDQDEIVLIDPADEEPAEPEDEITIVDPAEDEPEDPLPPPEKEKEEETRSVQPPVELGDISDYPEITAGEPQQVDISTPGQYAYFRFTPTETKVYQYYSSSVEGSEYKDTYGYLYGADMSQIASNDDGGEDNNFYIDALLEAGVTYVLGSRFYNTSNGVGSYLVTVEEAGTDYFRAYADGGDQINVEYGGSCTLRVIAVTNNEVSYRWRYDYADDYIEGADSDSYTLENVTDRCQIICNVSDDQGHSIDVWFYVGIDTELRVRIAGTDDTYAEYTLVPEESITLAVDASVSVGGLRYVWYSNWEKIEGADGDTYTIENVKSGQRIECAVYDDFGHSNTVEFQIYLNNGFFAYADEEHTSSTVSKYVPYENSVEMYVYAGCTVGELHYKWYDSGWNEMPVTDPLCTFGPVTERTTFYCVVTDDYGSSRTVTFYVYVDSGLYAYCAGTENTSDDLDFEPHDDVTMEVVAGVNEGAGEVHYQWYRDDNWQQLEGETESQLTIRDLTESRDYYCHVSDDYGNSQDVYFHLHIDNGFYARVAGTESSTYVYRDYAPHSAVTLEVDAGCNLGELHYQWSSYDQGTLDGATSATYSISDFLDSDTYYCIVSDDYGSRARVYFNLRVENSLFAYAAGTDEESYSYVSVAPAAPFTLGVVAGCNAGELHYQWYNNNWNAIEGATGSEFYVADGISGQTYYYCEVRDDYDSSTTVTFYCQIENHFVAYVHDTSRTDTTIKVSVGQDVNMIVDASCDQGEIHYQWMNNDWNDIEGANTNSYTVTDVRSRQTITCRVSDDYGSVRYVYFYIQINTGLYAYAAGTKLNEVYYYIDTGSSIDLAVDAGVYEGAGEIHYVWYVSNSDGSMSVIDGATGPQLSLTNITSPNRYQCTVSDDFGSTRYVTFRVETVSQFNVYAAGSQTQYVKSGNSVTLKVIATGVGELEYQWHIIQDGQSVPLEGQTASSFTTGPITEQTSYVCYVSDEADGWGVVDFTVCIDSELSAYADGSSYYEVDPGGSAEMRVVASVSSGEIHYQWYCNGDMIEAATDDHYTAENITSYTEYTCYVRDDYGNQVTISFTVSIRGSSGGDDPIPPLDEIPELKLGEFSTAEITEPYTLDYFRFTPTETGYYRFYSNSNSDTYGYLYDSDHQQLAYNDDSGMNTNFTIAYRLTAGETYILGVRFYDRSRTGSFPVTVDDVFLTAEPDGYSSFSVDLGGSVTMKVKAEGRGELKYTWYDRNWDAVSGATGSELTVSDIRENTQYICEVRDSFNNSVTVWFYISINSHLTVMADGDTTVFVDYKGSCTLGVIASVDSGALHYQWYRDGSTSHLLPNGNAATYTVSNVISSRQIGCQVTDDYGNSRMVSFTIHIKSDLSAGIDGTNDRSKTYTVDIGEDLNLKVTASCSSGSVNYQWYRTTNGSYPIGNQSSDPSVMELSDIRKSCQYRCDVSDNYGNSISLYFYINIENGFTAKADGPTRLSVEPGSSVTMKVKATATNGDLHYQWYEAYVDYHTISGATGDSYTANNIQTAGYYECHIWDDYGNSAYVYFQIGIENGFYAYAEGSRQILIEEGSDVTLKVIAHANNGDLHYEWYDTTYQYQSLGVTGDTVALTNVTSYRSIRCYVRDDYGNSANIYFEISIENGFTAYADGTNQNWAEIYVPYGGSATLKVDAHANVGTIRYRWYDENWNVIPDETGASLTLTNVDHYQQITCNAYDEFGNGEAINFEVYVQNDFHAYVKGTTWNGTDVTVDYGDSATLEVDVKGTDLTSIQSSWDELLTQADGRYYVSIEGASGYSLTVNDVTASRQIRFSATDKYGNPAYVYFNVNVNNNFRVYCNDTDYSYIGLKIPAHSSTDLSVRVEADNMENLSYFWYYYEIDKDGNSKNYTELPSETGPSITTPILSGNYYFSCRVTDYYGTEAYASFNITASEYKLNKNNATMKILDTLQLKMLDGAGKTAQATWSSSNEDVATVDQNGKVTAKKYGYTLIRAVAPDGTYDTCQIMTLFRDVTDGSKYYFNPVYWAADRGITVGYTSGANNGKFGVGFDCQRRELLIFLWRYAGEPTVDKNGKPYGNAQDMFNDLKSYGPTSATNKAIAWACTEGITKGYSDGGFHPTDPIERKDVMILLYRLAGKPSVTGTLSFSDCKSYKPGTDTYNAILWGSQNAITKGYSDGTFGPRLNCLREQIVTFLYRYNNL